MMMNTTKCSECQQLEYGRERMKGDTTMRYQVKPIADNMCNSLTREILGEFETDEEMQAWFKTTSFSLPFGVGVLDTTTGLIDFGQGFGVEIEATE